MENKSISDLIDVHVHVGLYENVYHEPEKIASYLLEEKDIKCIGVSSISACKEPYNISEILNEVKPLIKKWKNRIFHWLWIHPEHIPSSLSQIKQEVPVHGLKVHPYRHDWTIPGKIEEAFTLAEKEGIPILLHTGGNEVSDAGYFDKILSKFPKVTVILAHARPIDEALKLVKKHSNVWMDTAFVPEEDIEEVRKSSLMDRFLFGSDYPITKHYNFDYHETFKNFSDQELLKMNQNAKHIMKLGNHMPQK